MNGRRVLDLEEGQRTTIAGAAVDLATAFTVLFGAQQLRGTRTYRVELSAPEGNSTGGGLQGMQRILLISERDGATVVAGSVRVAAKTARLRSFDVMTGIQQQRAPGIKLGIHPVAYGELLARMSKFLGQRGLSVSTEAPGEEEERSDPGRNVPPVTVVPRRRGLVPLVLVGLGLALVAVAVLWRNWPPW